MKHSYQLCLWSSILILAEPCFSNAASAQIVPDLTLGSESSLFDNSLITGGATRETTLFHSFSLFNIADGENIFFDNPLNIDNILTRVTGDQDSFINGTLGVNGPANLFLINPNGITFGSGARLDLEGSFTASTADRFTLGNGDEFRATNPNAPPLVAVNIDVGLQFAPNSSAEVDNQANLSSRQNLTLAGHRVDSSGTLTASNGQVVVEGVAGSVNVRQVSAQSASLSASQDLILEDSIIQVDETIILTGNNIAINDSEVSASESASLSASQDLIIENDSLIQAVDSLTLTGNNISINDSELRIPEQNFSTAESIVSGDIAVTATGNVTINDSTLTTSHTYYDYSEYVEVSGDITISGDTVSISGSDISTALEEEQSYYNYSPIENLASGVVSISGNTITISESTIDTGIQGIERGGVTGDIELVATSNILIQDDTNITTDFSAFTNFENTTVENPETILGETGDITISSGDSVTITDNSLVEIDVSEIGNFEFEFLDGETTEFNLDLRGGNISVDANNSIEISNDSRISNSANVTIDEVDDELTTGNVNISTNRLTIEDGAEIAIINRQGLAGTGTITANAINLDRGTIRTETGESSVTGSGDIIFDLPATEADTETEASGLVMTNESLISSTGFNGATAGSISLENLPRLLGLTPTGENGSDIISRGDLATAGERGAITVGQDVSGFTFQTAVPGNRTNDIETDPPPEPPDPPDPELPEFIEPRSEPNAFTPASTTFPESLERVRSYCETADTNDPINRGVAINGRGGLPTTPTDPLEAPVEESGWIQPATSPVQPTEETTLVWSDGERTAVSCHQVWTTGSG
ncbi:MAG: filamentous hemagglutinin N-terminal domain-containing protein [Cyanobacteria bacterium P01_F01_bin.116]